MTEIAPCKFSGKVYESGRPVSTRASRSASCSLPFSSAVRSSYSRLLVTGKRPRGSPGTRPAKDAVDVNDGHRERQPRT